MHGDLLDDVLRDGGELTRAGHVITVTQSQPPVGSLTAGKHLTLVGNQKEGLGAASNGDRIEGGENVREDWQLDLGPLQSAQLVFVVEAPDE